MGSRWFLSLLTVIALLFGGMHSAAMATEMAGAPVVSVTVEAPCHMAGADSGAQKAPDKPDCCPGDCDGACTPAAAFFASPAAKRAGFVRTDPAPPVMAAAPSVRAAADERPPKISA